MNKLKQQLTITMAAMCLLAGITGCENGQKGTDAPRVRDADRSILNIGIKGGNNVKVEKKVENIIKGVEEREKQTCSEDAEYVPEFICDDEYIGYNDTNILDNIKIKIPAYNAIEYDGWYRLSRPDKLDIITTTGKELDNNAKLESTKLTGEKQLKKIIEKEIIKGCKVRKIDIADKLKIKINDIETERFMGSIEIETAKGKNRSVTYRLCGYTFICENKPVTIYGVAKDGTEYSKEVANNLDEMMRTIQKTK
mgnify:FL=1